MARPRKHKSPWPAYVRIRNGSYLYKDKKLCRVDEGESAMYKKLAELKALSNIDLVPAAIAQFKLDYLPTLSFSARKEHERILDIFSHEFREFRVDGVASTDIKKSVKNIYAGSLSAARSYKARISTFMRWCISDAGLININPCRDVWLAKPPKRKTKWTPELFWAVRELLSPMHQCYHELSFLLYQRTTDIRELMRSQAKGGVIHFEPSKTEDSSGLSVDIHITPAIQEVLDRAAKLAKLQAGPGGDAPVIQAPDGSIYTRSGIYSAYRRADAKIHGKDDEGKDIVIGLNPKALRPFAATWAKKMGYDIAEIQVGLAHTTAKTTEGYIHQHEVPVSALHLTLPERPK